MDFLLSRADTVAKRATDYLKLRRSDPGALTALLALNCVKRGKDWLNHYASRGWWRNCLNLSSSRVHTGYSGEEVLCFAFEYDDRFRDEFGYVVGHKVLQHYNLQHSNKPYRFGFDAPLSIWIPYPKSNPNLRIRTEHIDEAWAYFLTNPTGEMLCRHRARTSFDKRLAELSFDFKEPGLLGRFWNRIRLAFTV